MTLGQETMWPLCSVYPINPGHHMGSQQPRELTQVSGPFSSMGQVGE